jgi:hypothetical protein
MFINCNLYSLELKFELIARKGRTYIVQGSEDIFEQHV